MQTSHLKALKAKHRKLERDIHSEQTHAARNEFLIETLKKEKLYLKELIDRMQGRRGNAETYDEPPRRRTRSEA